MKENAFQLYDDKIENPVKEINSVDYQDLFRHVENLKMVLLVVAGRTGSDFFQSLLDGHSEILQFTGGWCFHMWWKSRRCGENLPDLINEFIWYTGSSVSALHIARFKSYYNKAERWDQLGDNKNEFFEVDIDIFKAHMLNILADREITAKNFFLAVNLAYGLATNMDIKKTKILFYHIHHIDRLKDYKEDFPNFDVICMIREPRNTLVSGMESRKEYSIDAYNQLFLFRLNRIFDEAEPILEYTKNIKTLKLEELHLFSREVLGEFCMTYGLTLKDCMFESSYHGKKWWGDALSGKYLDGFNKNINKSKWKDKLFFYDNFLMEFILGDRLKHYGYPMQNKISRVYLILAIFLVFLPMKYELKILSCSLRNSRNMKDRIDSVRNWVRFYIVRVNLYFKYIWKKVNKKIFLADFFNQERILKA